MSLIFSRGTFDRALTLPEIASRAPAVFADTKAERLTDRYGQVTTATAIEILDGFGFRPVQAAQVKARTQTALQHSHHMLAFARDGERGGDGRGEIVLYNSHDGTTALKLFAGYYRFICSNGMVAGDGFSAKLRHTAGTVAGFETMVRDTAASLPDLLDRIGQFQSRIVTERQARELAEAAASLRWERLENAGYDPETGKPLQGSYYSPRTVDQILRPRRWNDNRNDLWGTFNRIQESIIRGGVPIVSVTEKQPWGTERKAKGVASVRANVELNRELWNLAEAVAA